VDGCSLAARTQNLKLKTQNRKLVLKEGLMTKRRNWKIAAIAFSLVTGATGVSAQEGVKTTQGRGETVGTITRQVSSQDPAAGTQVIVGGGPGHADTFVFISSEMSIDGKVVKGAPYSAQAVTEMVQTLSDGNRIVRKNTANVYRDSEGRTRRDQTLGAIGPFAAGGDPPQTVVINDPVAGVHYMLDPRSRTAHKMPRKEFNFEFHTEAPDKVKSKLRRMGPDERKVETSGFVFATPVPPPGPHGPGQHGVADIRAFGHSSKGDAKTETLEKQTIEGVEAEGTRTTLTIPAGDIGNEQPIQIVTERWYSPELQTVVMSRHSDPRFGENTYRLTNISRSEPAATLFQVPSDYTVKEPGQTFRRSLEKRPGEVQ
jgi:hypothetical protein